MPLGGEFLRYPTAMERTCLWGGGSHLLNGISTGHKWNRQRHAALGPKANESGKAVRVVGAPSWQGGAGGLLRRDTS